jgi:epoxyqueuosine reductase
MSTELRSWICDAAQRHGFDLCGIAPAELHPQNRASYQQWLSRGFQGEMAYMERPERQDLRRVLPSVRSVICVGMVYHTAHPLSIESTDPGRGWIARYAWSDDYHAVMQKRLEQLLGELRAEVAQLFDAKVYVDTGPLLERALAAAAGLGWIAKNTCLINEQIGSWFFLGEILTSLELEPDEPVWDRCGTCTRCLEACPTSALVEPCVLDATRCISYHTIELRSAIPEEFRPAIGQHVFGCDICQDVCPWNREAVTTALPEFQPRPLAGGDCKPEATATLFNPPLESLAALTEQEFQSTFHDSPVRRSKYRGFLRNVAVAMGNSRQEKFRPLLKRLAEHSDPLIREHALWALHNLDQTIRADSAILTSPGRVP